MMDTETFVKAIRRHVRDTAVADTLTNLKNPPGRKVPADERARSAWFNALPHTEAAYVERIVKEAVDEAIFGFFAVLDGSRTVLDGRIDLVHVGASSVLLNDRNKIGLNEVFNAEE
jgi:hypothetical protein